MSFSVPTKFLGVGNVTGKPFYKLTITVPGCKTPTNKTRQIVFPSSRTAAEIEADAKLHDCIHLLFYGAWATANFSPSTYTKSDLEAAAQTAQGYLKGYQLETAAARARPATAACGWLGIGMGLNKWNANIKLHTPPGSNTRGVIHLLHSADDVECAQAHDMASMALYGVACPKLNFPASSYSPVELREAAEGLRQKLSVGTQLVGKRQWADKIDGNLEAIEKNRDNLDTLIPSLVGAQHLLDKLNIIPERFARHHARPAASTASPPDTAGASAATPPHSPPRTAVEAPPSGPLRGSACGSCCWRPHGAPPLLVHACSTLQHQQHQQHQQRAPLPQQLPLPAGRLVSVYLRALQSRRLLAMAVWVPLLWRRRRWRQSLVQSGASGACGLRRLRWNLRRRRCWTCY